MKFKSVYIHIIDAIFTELPLLFLTFFFLNPIWIGMIKNEPLGALKAIFCVDNVVSCDFYTSLLISLFICLIVGVLPRKCRAIIKTIIYLLLISTYITKKFLFSEFEMGYTAETLNLVLLTTPKESSGFIDVYLLSSTGVKYFMMFLLSCIFTFCIEWSYNKWIKKHILGKARVLMILALCVILPLGIKSHSKYFDLECYPECNSFTGINAAVKRIVETKKDGDHFDEVMIAVDKDVNDSSCTEDSLNVIFILGESLQKAHTSIYGYELPTTPFIDDEHHKGNLFAFQDVITPYSLTTPAMHSIFCLNSISDGEQWHDGVFFPQLFKKAGFNVYMWDSWKDPKYRYNNSFSEIYTPQATTLWLTDENRQTFSYDSEFAEDFLKSISLTCSKNLIIFHHIGSHFPYIDKYPKNDEVFKSTDIKKTEKYITDDKKKLIAEYDNSVAHMDKTIKILANAFRNTNAIVIFLSDHGDEVYDYRDKAVRPSMDENMKAQYLHCMHDVPLFVWCSEKYKNKHPETIQALSTAVMKKGVSDKVGYMVLSLAKIKTKYYNPARDILNPNYKIGLREVYFNSLNKSTHRVVAGNNGLDYDKVIQGQ